MIEGVSRLILDVDNQDRALAFWVEKIGFHLVQDAPYGDSGRWLEVRTRDGANSLVLSVRKGERPITQDELPTSNVFFYCDDLPRTYEELRARGVDFPQPPVEQAWGWWSIFEDQEGNRFALGQRER